MDAIEALGLCRGRMKEDLKLLQEALTAARKGKGHVVVDHLERVIDAQQRVLEGTSFKEEE